MESDDDKSITLIDEISDNDYSPLPPSADSEEYLDRLIQEENEKNVQIDDEILKSNLNSNIIDNDEVKQTSTSTSGRRASAGVIPIFVDSKKKRIRILAGRERNIAGWTEGSRKWSYFGGRKKIDDVDVFETAAREFVEESLAVIPNQNSIEQVADSLRNGNFLMRIDVGEPENNVTKQTQMKSNDIKWNEIFYFHTCFVVQVSYDRSIGEQFQTVGKLIRILKNACNSYIDKWNSLVKKVGKRFVPALRWPVKNNNEISFTGDLVPKGRLHFDSISNTVSLDCDQQDTENRFKTILQVDHSIKSIVLDVLELARLRDHVNRTFEECFVDFPSVKNHPAIWYGEDCWFINKDYLEKEEVGWFDLSHFAVNGGSDEGTSGSDIDLDLLETKNHSRVMVRERRSQVSSIHWRDAAYPVMQFLADNRDMLFFQPTIEQNQSLIQTGCDIAANLHWRITHKENQTLIEMVRPRIPKFLGGSWSSSTTPSQNQKTNQKTNSLPQLERNNYFETNTFKENLYRSPSSTNYRQNNHQNNINTIHPPYCLSHDLPLQRQPPYSLYQPQMNRPYHQPFQTFEQLCHRRSLPNLYNNPHSQIGASSNNHVPYYSTLTRQQNQNQHQHSKNHGNHNNHSNNNDVYNDDPWKPPSCYYNMDNHYNKFSNANTFNSNTNTNRNQNSNFRYNRRKFYKQ